MSPQKNKETKRKYSAIEDEEEGHQSDEENSSSDGEHSSGHEENGLGLFNSSSTFIDGDSTDADAKDVPLDRSIIQDLSLFHSEGDTKDKLVENLKQTVDQLQKELDQTKLDLKVATVRIEEYIKILKNQNLFLSKEQANLIVVHSKKKIFRYIKIVTNDMTDDTLLKDSVRVKMAMQILLPNEDTEERLKKWIVFKQSVIKGLKDQAKYQARMIKSRYLGK